MTADGPTSEESESDADAAEDVAYAVDTTAEGEVLVDPDAIESIASDSVDGDVAVMLPSAAARGGLHGDDVDGTDAEALFEEEDRETGALEDELTSEDEGPPDLFDLGQRHHPERPS